MTLKAPFPYFGGKARIAEVVWQYLGDVPVYVEPFFGSGAVLLNRPHAPRIETVNDIDGLLANAWRAIQLDPEAVAYHADSIVSEVDLHAWHALLVRERGDLTERLMADPTYCDPVLAGKWIWGASCWIGSGWCSGRGPWQVVDGKLVKVGEGIERKRPALGQGASGVHGAGIERTRPHLSDGERGINSASGGGVERNRPHLMHAGKGVHRKVPHLGDFGRSVQQLGIALQLPHLGGAGRSVHRPDGAEGISRQLPDRSGDGGATGRGVHASARSSIYEWMQTLSTRLRRVRICCGDWSRIMGPAGTVHTGLTGAFIDPPYRHADRDPDLYAQDHDVWDAVRSWSIEHGGDARYRIVLAGYADDPSTMMPAGWTWHVWSSAGGYGNQGMKRGRDNARRECLWCSPFCRKPQEDLPLFVQAVNE